MTSASIIQFWFEEIRPAHWWKKDPDFDAMIAERFGTIHAAASRGELSDWRTNAEGRLAEIIVLDQFSRNIFRGDARAFAHDEQALALAREAVATGADQHVDTVKRPFFYLPYMHSETAAAHEEAVALYTALGSNLAFELQHKTIIDRFGRYPHRNEILGRASTAAELEFLKQKGSSF